VTLAAEFDWSSSDFGPQDHWEPTVAAVVRTLLEAAAPMAYCHGANLAMVYNDRFADLLGVRHPRAWGQRAPQVMPEIWARPGYAKAVDSVLAGGPAFNDAGEMLDLLGRQESHPEWAYLARSYSAVRDSYGSVLGVLIVAVETAPVLVLVGGDEPGSRGAGEWRGIELWDQTAAHGPLIWSGFRAGARSPEAAVAEPDQRFVADGGGRLILPINGPDIGGSIGYLGVPRNPPNVQLVTLAARARAEATGTALGGEFYDVFSLPDGRLAVTIGDVVGADTAAAAAVTQIKAGMRGAAAASADPNTVFAALDELVGRLDRDRPVESGPDLVSSEPKGAGFGGELFVTALLGMFDPATGDLLVASAGHSPPAIVRRQTETGAQPDEVRLADYIEVEPGPPLGITGNRPVTRVGLQEGDALVAFTNGLLQRHAGSPAQSRARLLRTLRTMSSTAPRSISQDVVDTMIGDGGLEHDCALLVVVRDSKAHQVASVIVPPHPIAVRGAREWVRAQLGSWGLDEEIAETAVMCVSELISNVVQHAGTFARLTLELAGRLLVTVQDTGMWNTPRAEHPDYSASRGRGLALVGAVSDAMGHARGVDGSTVWFEIVLDRTGA